MEVSITHGDKGLAPWSTTDEKSLMYPDIKEVEIKIGSYELRVNEVEEGWEIDLKYPDGEWMRLESILKS